MNAKVRGSDAKVVAAYCSHGHAPYILAAAVGKQMGNVIVPYFEEYRNQCEILRYWVGSDRVYLDANLGELLSRVSFKGDYRDFIFRNVRYGKDIREEIRSYEESGFDTFSLDGKKRHFDMANVRLSLGARNLPFPERTYYIFPALGSETAERCPYEVKDREAFIEIVRREEEKYRAILIPEANTFSYTTRQRMPMEVSVPPLALAFSSDEVLEADGVYYSLSGTGSGLNREVIKAVEAAQRLNLVVYKPKELELQYGIDAGAKAMLDSHVIAVIARAGFGTLWNLQVAERPIIAPEFKEGDDPEVYHNNKTVTALGLGVVFDSFDEDVLRNAMRKPVCISALNRHIVEKYGSLDGIEYAASIISGIEESQ